MLFFKISLENRADKTTHNTFGDCRVHFFRQPFRNSCIILTTSKISNNWEGGLRVKGARGISYLIFASSWETSASNITGLKTPTGRRQPVGYLQAWPRIWTRDDRAQIQQVARAGLEPGTAGLWVRRADHSATLPPHSRIANSRRAVINRQGPGISPGYYERGPRLLSKENRTKISP